MFTLHGIASGGFAGGRRGVGAAGWSWPGRAAGGRGRAGAEWARSAAGAGGVSRWLTLQAAALAIWNFALRGCRVVPRLAGVGPRGRPARRARTVMEELRCEGGGGLLAVAAGAPAA